MSLSLGRPSPQYDATNEAQMRAALETADGLNYKKGQDIEITSTQRLIMTDTVTGFRGVVSVAAGVVTFTAL